MNLRLDTYYEIKSLLVSKLLHPTYDIDAIYKSFQDFLQQQFYDQIPPDNNDVSLTTSDLSIHFSYIQNNNLRTIGIDFPILLSTRQNRPVLMVCAMDPFRADTNHLPDENISYWVPFSIIKNPEKERKYSERENLLFFHTLLNSFDLYVTDIFKIFYRDNKKASNTIPSFMNLTVHKEILEKEISIIKPTAILTLGNNARNAICNLFDLERPSWCDRVYKAKNESGLTFAMIPHISGSANGYKSPILNNKIYEGIEGANNLKYANIVLSELYK